MNNQTVANQYGEDYQQQEPIYTEEGSVQPQLTGGGTPYYQPMIMPSEKADLYDKIRPEDVVETIRYLLMGFEFDKMRGTWTPKPEYQNVALSQLGAWQLSTLLLPVANKNVSISKLTDPEIRVRTKMLVRSAMKMCLRNWHDYGIRSPEQLFFVKEIVLSIAFITLKQPEGAGVRTFIQGVTQENRIVTEAPKKEGALGAIFRR